MQWVEGLEQLFYLSLNGDAATHHFCTSVARIGRNIASGIVSHFYWCTRPRGHEHLRYTCAQRAPLTEER